MYGQTDNSNHQDNTMKTTRCFIKLALTLAACLSAVAPVQGAETTNATATASVPENLGYYVEAGKSNKITRIITATPAYVQVMFGNDGNIGSRKIPRNELPPELAARFPYDAEKSAEHQKRQAALDAQQRAAQQAAQAAAQQEAARRRLLVIDAEIERLGNQDVQMQMEVNILHHLPPGNGRKVRLAHLLDQQQALRERSVKLREIQQTLR